jgi:hypothetical protein
MGFNLEGDFLSEYIQYTKEIDCPTIYSRWAAIVGIGALLGRDVYIQRGHYNIYPQIYAMLIGTSGTGKGTSIKLISKLLKQLGYNSFAPNKVKPETFLKYLADEGFSNSTANGHDLLDEFLWKETIKKNEYSEIFIAVDEFNNFIGVNNLDFISILGELWGIDEDYKNPLATKQSVYIKLPTVSILGGNTPTNFHTAFPPEILNQGFFSRLLLIYGESNDSRILFPRPPAKEDTDRIIAALKKIKSSKPGIIAISPTARKLLEKIYRDGRKFDDIRFDTYNTRRITHLFKLCTIISRSWAISGNELCEEQVIYANTILTHAEQFMTKALGEFGRAKNSNITHKVLQLLENSNEGLELHDIWKHVSQDLETIRSLTEIIQNLLQAEKVQHVKGTGKLLIKKRQIWKGDDTVDFSLLTENERNMKL